MTTPVVPCADPLVEGSNCRTEIDLQKAATLCPVRKLRPPSPQVRASADVFEMPRSATAAACAVQRRLHLELQLRAGPGRGWVLSRQQTLYSRVPEQVHNAKWMLSAGASTYPLGLRRGPLRPWPFSHEPLHPDTDIHNITDIHNMPRFMQHCCSANPPFSPPCIHPREQRPKLYVARPL